MLLFERFDPAVKKILQNGGIGVLPTDTIYGISGSAFSRAAVDRIYRAKRRPSKSPFIVLIPSIDDLKKFDICLDAATKQFLKRHWPGKVSVILPCASKKFAYLHRGTHAIAFRMPRYPALRKLLRTSGPLVSSSANISGEPSATSIRHAILYFKQDVDFYVDKGAMKSPPSTLVRMENGKPVILRLGAAKKILIK